jgi:molecular chaperone DnaJ
MAQKRDYYEVLGVSKNADAEALKKAYRKLAMQHHPDKNPGDKAAEQKFKELNEAYDVLKDDQRRAAYDRFGHQAFEGGRSASGGGFGGGTGGAGFDFTGNFSDIFEDFFGGMGARSGGGGTTPSHGSDLRYNLSVTLEEAFKGKQENIKITTSVSCDSCHGSGAETGSKPITCPTCNGHGRVRASQGFFTIERTCASCQGTGKIIKDPCRKCAGSGRMRKEKSLLVNIPAGVEEGTRIRLAHEGEAGFRGGEAGDLYIFISLKKHPFLLREGSNLLCKIPIPFTTAALGGSIEAPTIDGSKVKVTIPEGTATGHQFRLKGKGMSSMRGGRGDMYIQVDVETPVNLTKQQKELLKQFENAGGSNTNPASEGFFKKAKEFWGH